LLSHHVTRSLIKMLSPQRNAVTVAEGSDEIAAITARYERRGPHSQRYSMLSPSVYMAEQEKERAYIRWITTCRLMPISEKRLLEIGCGYGGNVLQLLRLGFAPNNIVANELLEERAATARQRLPAQVSVLVGDASQLDLPSASFDIVLQSTTFSSILDKCFQERLAARLWSLIRPGGGFLWYDFIYDNPWNPDVRGVSLHRIRELFPDADMTYWPITLAPPISRLVTRIHPELYRWFAAVRFLRTHVLCWIRRTNSTPRDAGR